VAEREGTRAEESKEGVGRAQETRETGENGDEVIGKVENPGETTTDSFVG